MSDPYVRGLDEFKRWLADADVHVTLQAVRAPTMHEYYECRKPADYAALRVQATAAIFELNTHIGRLEGYIAFFDKLLAKVRGRLTLLAYENEDLNYFDLRTSYVETNENYVTLNLDHARAASRLRVLKRMLASQEALLKLLDRQ